MACLLPALEACYFDTRAGTDSGEETGSGSNAYECACDCFHPNTTVSVRPAASEDDAEEVIATGVVLTTSFMLDIPEADGAPQLVGVRFPRLGVPHGSRVIAANIQFVASQPTSEATNVLISGESADDAAAFAPLNGNLSTRLRTTAAVNWVPPPWLSAGDSGPPQLTPDLAPILQEVIDRPGWTPSSAAVVLLSGTGLRQAIAYDGQSLQAPMLTVQYNEPTISIALPVCMPEHLDPNVGDNGTPTAGELNHDCATRVAETVSGLALACGDPSPCQCEAVLGSSFFDEVCIGECVDEPVTANCANFDLDTGLVTATHAPGDEPVCTVAAVR